MEVSDIVKGAKLRDKVFTAFHNSPFKVMGVVDGWVMMRRKSCAPSCYHINDVVNGQKFELVVK